MVHVPGCEPGVKKAVVQPMDFMPTILDLARIKRPETVHGRSFADVLKGKADQHRSFAVSSPYMGGAPVPATVVSGRWAGILWSATKEAESVEDKAVDGLAKTQATRQRMKDMLFDLRGDARQKKNVAARHPRVMADLRRKMLAFLEEIGADEEIVARWRRE